MSFKCRRCGETHEMPLSFAFEAPVYWSGVPADERARRVVLDDELCAIDGQHFFIKGRIRIPILETADAFEWVVWVSLSEANFTRAITVWEHADRVDEPPYFGWLSSTLPGYPSTLNLKTELYTRPPGERPIVELEPTEHPLAVEQRTGISLARVGEIVEAVLHSPQVTLEGEP